MAKESNSAPGGFTQAINAIVTVTKEAFKGLPPTMKVMVALAAFAAILLLSVDIILGFAGKLPPWAIILLFIVSLLFFVFIAVLLVRSESRKKPPSTCRHVPIYPLREEALQRLKAALGEIRTQAYRSIAQSVSGFALDSLRANIFLLAKTDQDGYKLVIHPQLRANMKHPPEWNIQFSPGREQQDVPSRRILPI